ncbi:hypothetical protein EDD15DRAFT_2518356 [Pisolithus albus]|nr:hypothetical protein EDD15DRAFT_2518356 [Pisolithus albus]
MRFGLLAFLVAPFITAVVGAAVSPNNVGLQKKGEICIAEGDCCDSLKLCCLGNPMSLEIAGMLAVCPFSFNAEIAEIRWGKRGDVPAPLIYYALFASPSHTAILVASFASATPLPLYQCVPGSNDYSISATVEGLAPSTADGTDLATSLPVRWGQLRQSIVPSSSVTDEHTLQIEASLAFSLQVPIPRPRPTPAILLQLVQPSLRTALVKRESEADEARPSNFWQHTMLNIVFSARSQSHPYYTCHSPRIANELTLQRLWVLQKNAWVFGEALVKHAEYETDGVAPSTEQMPLPPVPPCLLTPSTTHYSRPIAGHAKQEPIAKSIEPRLGPDYADSIKRKMGKHTLITCGKSAVKPRIFWVVSDVDDSANDEGATNNARKAKLYTIGRKYEPQSAMTSTDDMTLNVKSAVMRRLPRSDPQMRLAATDDARAEKLMAPDPTGGPGNIHLSTKKNLPREVDRSPARHNSVRQKTAKHYDGGIGCTTVMMDAKVLAV